MNPLLVTKMTGAGNDFLVLDSFHSDNTSLLLKALNTSSLSEAAQKLCDRHHHIGADGFLVLERSQKYDIKWDFYNADGSTAEMCGNAARCVAIYCTRHKLTTNPFNLETLSGKIECRADSDHTATVQMSAIKESTSGQFLNHQYQAINSGVPHMVIEVDRINQQQLRIFCEKVFKQKPLGPQGTNVTFFKVIKDQKIESVSYERGINDYTLACGTGATAAAYAFKLQRPEFNEVLVQVPGGQLEVHFQKETPYLQGPAEFTDRIEIL